VQETWRNGVEHDRPGGVIWALRVAATALILVATLRSDGAEPPGRWTTCLVCGDVGVAEIIQNVLLFIPFGLATALGRSRFLVCILSGAVLSLGVELAQQFIPGRDPNLGDLVFNTLGTALGAITVGATPRSLDLPPALAASYSLVAALASGGVIAAPAIALQPSGATPPVETQWLPDLPRLAHYSGAVTAARLGPDALAPGRLRYPARAHSAWSDGAPLSVTLVQGPPPRSFSPAVALLDSGGRRYLLLGISGTDVVLWPRTRAADWKLDQPDLRFRGALAGTSPGDTTTLGAMRRRDGYCLMTDEARRCNVGYGIAQGWTLVLHPESFPPWLNAIIGVAWIATLAAPVGLWWRRGAASTLALLLVLGAVTITPVLADFGTARLLDVVAVVVGVGMGWVTARLAAPPRG
jgi:hypothetical protein